MERSLFFFKPFASESQGAIYGLLFKNLRKGIFIEAGIFLFAGCGNAVTSIAD